MPKNTKISSLALAWWKKQVLRHDIIVTRTDFPSDYIKTWLIHNHLASKIKNGLYILKKHSDDPKHQILLSYFKIINKVLSTYHPWSIKGISALEIYLGIQKIPTVLHVRTARKIKYIYRLTDDLSISIIYDPCFNKHLVQTIKHLGEKINIDIPERILFDIKKFGKKEKQFLKSQKFDYRLLEIIYRKTPTPIIFQKLCKILPTCNQEKLSQEMKTIMNQYTFYKSNKAGDILTPQSSHTTSTQQPWTLRQSDQIKYFANQLDKKFKKHFTNIPKFSLNHLLQDAQEKKEYDIYHSTTIEGYSITPEDVRNILLGSKDIKKRPSRETLRNNMAIMGYKDAFNFVLKKIKNDFLATTINEDFIKDVFFKLFHPSVDAGIIDKYDLIKYRNIQNYIRGSRFIPPSPKKVLDLMENFSTSINQIVTHPITKAILVHFLFVSIHPYIDGNGRTARLLMNYILLGSGYRWVTIPLEYRQRYFSALETAQVDDNIIPFAKLIIELLDS